LEEEEIKSNSSLGNKGVRQVGTVLAGQVSV